MAKKFPVVFSFKGFDQSVGRTVDRLNTRFGALSRKLTNVNNKFRVTQKRTETLRKSMTKAGRAMRGFGRSMSTFVTLPITAAAVAMTKAASDADETANKFGVVFDKVDKATRDNIAAKLAKDFKLADSSAQEFLGSTGLILQGLDLTQDKALGASAELVGLAQDVASLRNVQGGAASVIGAFNSALVGERERLKTLGIVITEADVKAQALEMAQRGVTFETLKQAKALATLEIIRNRTAKDQGDFARTQDQLANKTRILAEKIKSVAERFGKLLIPVFLKLATVAEKVLTFFENMPEGMKTVVLVAGALAAAMGPVLVVLGQISLAIPALISALPVLGGAFAALSGPIGIAIAAVAGLTAAGFALFDSWKDVKNFFVNLWDGPLVSFLRWVTGFDRLISLAKLIIDNWKPVKEFFADMFKNNFLVKAAELGLGIGKRILFGGQDPTADPRRPIVSEESKAKTIGKTIVSEMRSVNDARVTMDFMNMPRGTQISTQSTGIPPELNLGMSGAMI